MAATGPELARIAAQAGAIVMRHYAAGTDVRWKPDHSPVTDADEETERFILAALNARYPGVPVVAEEEAAAGHPASAAARFFLVDPLDGTKEFLSRNGEFTVNIAEIENGVCVAGAVYAPAKARLFWGDKDGARQVSHDAACDLDPGLSAGMRPIHARTAGRDGLVAIGSRSHKDAATEEFLKSFHVRDYISAGSSLKFCLVAAGEADIYARGGRTMEWDTAAGHAVLRAAGGEVRTWNDQVLRYGKPGFANPPFVARGKI